MVPLMNLGAYILTTKGSWCQDVQSKWSPNFPWFCLVFFFHMEVIGKETAGDVDFVRSI